MTIRSRASRRLLSHARSRATLLALASLALAFPAGAVEISGDFTTQFGVTPGDLVWSNSTVVDKIDTPTAISVIGGQYQIGIPAHAAA